MCNRPDVPRLSVRRAGLGAFAAMVGICAMDEAAIAQSSAGVFRPAFESKHTRSSQPPVDFEIDSFEVYLAPWGEY